MMITNVPAVSSCHGDTSRNYNEFHPQVMKQKRRQQRLSPWIFLVLIVTVLSQSAMTTSTRAIVTAFVVTPTNTITKKVTATTTMFSSSNNNDKDNSNDNDDDTKSNGKTEDDDDDDGELIMTEYERALTNFESLIHENSDSFLKSSCSNKPSQQQIPNSVLIPMVQSCFHPDLSSSTTATKLPPPLPLSFWYDMQQSNGHDYYDYTMYHPIPMTETIKNRRMYEIQLLKSLEESDDGLDLLQSLWMSEREYEYVVQLEELQYQQYEEDDEKRKIELEIIKLQSMIDNHSKDGYVEPLYQLAQLYYDIGNLYKAKHYCLVGLCYKPWHFGISDILTSIAIDEENRLVAKYWDDWYALPPLHHPSNHKKRKAWVKRAIQHVHNSFKQSQLEMERIQKKQEKEQEEFEYEIQSQYEMFQFIHGNNSTNNGLSTWG